MRCPRCFTVSTNGVGRVVDKYREAVETGGWAIWRQEATNIQSRVLGIDRTVNNLLEEAVAIGRLDDVR